MYKKFICLCLAICLVFTLAACNEQASQQGKNQTPEDDKNNVTTPKEKSVKLSFWDMAWGPPETYPPVVEKLVNKFEEENPNTEVEIQTIAWDNFYQTFLTAIASGTISDVATMGASLPIQFHSMGALEPLNSILDEWKQEGKYDDISQEDYDTFIFDGEVGAVPWQLDPRGFVYRKDVFEKVGISKMPEDWNDFLDILRKIKQNTEYIPFVFGGAGFHHHVAYQFQILKNSGMVTEDLKADKESERFVEVHEFINTLVKEELIPEATVGYKQNEARKLYYSGKAAIMLDVMSAEILNYPEISDNSGVLPVFKAPNGIKASASWANPISVFKQSKNVSLAKKLIDLLIKPIFFKNILTTPN